jgi:hypothetical protein
VALALARSGHRVTAIDTSTAATADLRRAVAADPELTDRVEVIDADFTDPASVQARVFRVAVLGDLSINMFGTGEAIEWLLTAVTHALQPSGVFCFPVLEPAGLDGYRHLHGVTAMPFADGVGRQSLLWLIMRYEAEGPHFWRTLFMQDDRGSDGAVTAHVTAVRERLWTPHTLTPHLARAGLTVRAAVPLHPAGQVMHPPGAVLLTVTREGE